MTAESTERPAEAGWTVGRIIDWTTGHLKKHGSESPRLEAEILLAFARGCPRIQLYVQYNDLLTDAQRATMRDLVLRRAQSEPVAYLVGHREFFGLDFHVSRDVLVPRPETETLVLELLAIGKPLAMPRVLDLGTGSGCIAISAAVHLPAASVTAVDISGPALGVAKGNAARHQVAGRIDFREGDLFSPLDAGATFDIIASNPPYVAEGEMESLPADVRLHEPHSALQAGPQGLDVLERIIATAPGHLVSGGWLLLEFSPEQAEAVTGLLEGNGSFAEVAVVKDVAGQWRVSRARRV